MAHHHSVLLSCTVAATLAVGCMSDAAPPEESDAAAVSNTRFETAPMTMTLSSPDFAQQEKMPAKLSCEGDDTSPELTWSEVPKAAKSLALVVDDPDAPDPAAPKRVWVHWVVFNIPPGTAGLPAGAGKGGKLPDGASAGKNDWGRAEYGGPCPPKGRHRYFHKLYALDTVLDLEGPTKAELEAAMEGHVIARGELVGTYEKRGGTALNAGAGKATKRP